MHPFREYWLNDVLNSTKMKRRTRGRMLNSVVKTEEPWHCCLERRRKKKNDVLVQMMMSKMPLLL
jgi:hypothetical protein